MKNASRFGFAVVLFLSLLLSQASQAITAGGNADGDESTVLVIATSGAQTGFCSGVVVSPHVVVTAAHCVDATFDYEVFLGVDFNDADEKALAENYVAVEHVEAHPDWSATTNLNDIGVLITSAPVPVEPATLNTRELVAEDIGAAIRIVGYGQTESGGSMGKRTAATSTLAGIDPTGLAMQGVPNICLFDSGGPTFLDGALVGVHSLVDSVECDGLGIDTRVDPYVDFIETHIAAIDPPAPTPDPPENDEEQPAGCALAGLQPCALALLALLVLLRRVGTSPRVTGRGAPASQTHRETNPAREVPS